MTSLTRIFVAALAATAGLLLAPGTAHAEVECADDSRGVVVVLHDLAAGPSSMNAIATNLAVDGWCTVAPAYGSNAVPFNILPGGMNGVAASADEIAQLISDIRAEHASAPVHVVGHGVGSLVALRAAQTHPESAPDSIVAVGPLWKGTNIALLGSLEQLSRDAGTYDTVLAIEAPLEDPVCRVCRDIIQGSDLLREMQADGLEIEGLTVTNIMSRTDLLVQPSVTNGSLPWADNIILQQVSPLNLANHWTLPTDATVLRLIRAALN